MGKYWIGVDLDGTLAVNDGTQNGEIGEPIIPMMTLVKEWINEGTQVRIFTARAVDSAGIRKVEDWLRQYGLGGLKVTNKKDPDMALLYDDKAIRVQRNTGNLCYMCQHLQDGHMHSQADKGNAMGALLTDC